VEKGSSVFSLAGRKILSGAVRNGGERKRVEVELDAYHNHIEQLVRERTAELRKAKRTAYIRMRSECGQKKD